MSPTKTDNRAQTKNADLIARLRERTQGEHRNVEAIPFNVRVMQGAVTLREYATLLECHLIIHEALDNRLATHRDDRVASVFRADQAKTDRIAADLRAIGLPATDHDTDSIVRARGLAQTINWLADDAGCALGFFYVFEGSTMGGMVLRKRFAESLDLDDDALNFYGAYGRETAMRWRATCARFNAAPLDRTEVDRAVAAANLAFLEIGHMLEGF
jgi:heme oxygenase